MATAIQRKEDHLTCIICAELYTDPITLTCGHTFCRKCVTEYIKTQPDVVKAKSIPCAYCRQSTRVPNPTAPVDEWAAQFNLNIVILGLLDDIPSASKNTDGKCICTFCSKLGETTQSTFWCDNCEVSLCDRCAKMHRIGPATCDHDLLTASKQSNQPSTRNLRCKLHKQQCIASYCIDCKKPACQTCLILFHRACKTAVPLVPHMVSELQKTKQVLSERILKRTHRRDTISTNNRLQMKKTTLRTQIASARQGAVDKIDGEVKRLLGGIDNIIKQEVDLLKKNLAAEASQLQSSRQVCDTIDEALTSKSAKDLYTVFQTCQALGETDTIKTDGGHGMSELTFVSDSNMLRSFRLGEILRISAEAVGVCRLTAAVPKHPIHPLFLEGKETVIDVNVASEDMEPSIHDITVILARGYQVFIIADTSNNAVTCLYRRKKVICHSKIQLQDSPWSLARSSGDQVMALVPKSKQIVTIEATPELKLVASITTSKMYWCLAVSGPAELVACGGQYKTARVDILDMSGSVLRSIRVHDEFIPEFMCVHGKRRILVSDKGQRSVICLTLQDGDTVVWMYKPTERKDAARLLQPQGITTTPTGEVLLVDKAKRKITKLTELGDFVQDFNTQQQPKSITCDEHGIYVAYETSIQVVQC